jgi:hypothetical protein
MRTVLFADMRGYTRFTQEHVDEAASSKYTLTALTSRRCWVYFSAVPAATHLARSRTGTAVSGIFVSIASTPQA